MAIQASAKPAGASASLILTSGASGRVNALFSMRVLRSLLTLIQAFVLLLLVPFRGRRRAAPINSAIRDDKQDGGVGSLKKGAVMRVPATIVPWRSSSSSLSGVVAVDQEVAVRRALAIRRVVQDNDNRTARGFSLFASPRGDTLFTQSWTPVSLKIRGLIVLLHGLNEHSGRYGGFAKQLNANGFKVYGMDWIVQILLGLGRGAGEPLTGSLRGECIINKHSCDSFNGLPVATGHGGSDGLHAYVHSLDHAVSDLKSFLEKVLAENPGLPCFCFGHSTGAAIILKAVLDPKVEACVAGAVLTSPAVGVQPSHPIFTVLAPVVSFLFPRHQFSAANKKGMPVSRDPEALVAKYSDPLVYTGSIRVRTGYEILRISSYLQQNLKRLRISFLVLHGSADTVTDPEASKKLYEEASSTDKDIKLFDGLLHDLLFEPEGEAIAHVIIKWLNCRV